MKGKEIKEQPACHDKNAAFPDEINCPHCKSEIEVWSDETEVSCKLCGNVFPNDSIVTH